MAQQSIASLSELVRRFLPVLLGVCYLVALMVPGPGQRLHAWHLPPDWPDVLRPGISQLLVAVLLFLAALGVEVSRLPIVAQRPGLLFWSLAAVWVTPVAVVLPVWWMLTTWANGAATSELLVGFALVAAMPVANSSAGWTQQSRGELPWTLALVVFSIVACPWMIPLVLRLFGLSFSPDEADALEQLTTSFTGMEFVVWVLLPTGLGMLVRWLVGPQRVIAHRQAVLLLSATVLLLLNYVNAAAALPSIRSELRPGWLIASIATAVLLCLTGLGVSRLLGRMFSASGPTVAALDYSLSMKNTGLALALASDVLMDHPKLLLPVFTMTLVQHLFAGALHRRRVNSAEGAVESAT